MAEGSAPQDPRPGRRAAVLGSPIAHSLSPALHRAAYADLDLDWTYAAIDVDVEALPAFLATLDDSWAGLSLTMPLKEVVIDLLDEVDAVARAVRAVNTVLPAPTGWRGTNTDIYGMTQALAQAGARGPVPRATLLGAGATARSAVAALAALGVQSLTVCARRPAAAQDVADLAASMGLGASTASLEPDADLLAAEIVVSTLPGTVARPWAAFAGLARGVLLDVSYYPWPTALAAAWGSSTVANGREMLVWQAAEQVRLMTGRFPSVARMAAALPD
jgi:shikimate dehydrogenase